MGLLMLQRKAAEVEEAAEEKATAVEAPAAEERPAKRRAVAKGKKPAQALQPVEHPSHQKVSLQEANTVFSCYKISCMIRSHARQLSWLKSICAD